MAENRLKGCTTLQCPKCKEHDALPKFYVTHVLEENEIKTTEYQCPNCYFLFKKRKGEH